MTPSEAYKIFKKKYPLLDAENMVDYNATTYVICASRGNEISYDDLFYSIDKRSGKISNFLPSLNIDAFDAAAEERSIDIDDLM